MFFPLLNTEEKVKCLSLIKYAAMCDEDFHIKEEALIRGYSFLMGLSDASANVPIDDVVEYLSQRSEVVKRAAFLETLGLVEADGLYHRAEEFLVHRLAKAFGFDMDYVESARVWIKDVLPHYYKGFELVGVKVL